MTLIAPEREGEHPTNSETTSVEVAAPGAIDEPKQGPLGLVEPLQLVLLLLVLLHLLLLLLLLQLLGVGGQRAGQGRDGGESRLRSGLGGGGGVGARCERGGRGRCRALAADDVSGSFCLGGF